MNLGLKLEDVREEVLNLLGARRGSGEAATEERGPATQKGKSEQDTGARQLRPRPDRTGRQKKLDPVIGREREIERVMQILCRRTKNNPVLLGEAGVGKTAIVEGFAQMVVEATCPRSWPTAGSSCSTWR
jgi:ATP-dependent Clp protease ATP-binding subunit ClpC